MICFNLIYLYIIIPIYFQVKLSGRTNDIQVTWAGTGLLAVSTGDNNVRLWNLDSGDNYVLSLHGFSYRDQEYMMCLSYSENKSELF